MDATVHIDYKYCYCKEKITFASVFIYSSLVSFNKSQQQAAVGYHDRAGVSKGTLVGGTQFGTPIVKSDLNKRVISLFVVF